MLGKGLDAAQAVFVNDDNLARFDVAYKIGVDEVERAGFAGQNVGIAQLADGERAEAVRVAHADQLALRQDGERIRPLDAPDGFNQVVVIAAKRGLREQV